MLKKTKTNEMVANIHCKLGNPETRNYYLEKELADRHSEKGALEKDLKVKKEEIIQKINRGFIQKVCN